MPGTSNPNYLAPMHPAGLAGLAPTTAMAVAAAATQGPGVGAGSWMSSISDPLTHSGGRGGAAAANGEVVDGAGSTPPGRMDRRLEVDDAGKMLFTTTHVGSLPSTHFKIAALDIATNQWVGAVAQTTAATTVIEDKHCAAFVVRDKSGADPMLLTNNAQSVLLYTVSDAGTTKRMNATAINTHPDTISAACFAGPSIDAIALTRKGWRHDASLLDAATGDLIASLGGSKKFQDTVPPSYFQCNSISASRNKVVVASALGITMWDIRAPQKPIKEFRFPDCDRLRFARPAYVHTSPGVLVAHAGVHAYMWQAVGFDTVPGFP